MARTIPVLGLAAALLTGVAGGSFAAGGSLGSQNTTQTEVGAGGQNPMLARPANPGAQPVPGASSLGMNGHSTTSTYSGAVNSPTTPDANNPSTATMPSGGGAGDGNSGGGNSH